LKEWTEQLITAVAMLGVVALFIVCVHLPRQRTLRELRGQIHALDQKLSQTQRRCAVLMPLTRRVEALRANASALEERLPRDGQVGGFLQQVAEQLQQTQLASLEMRPAAPLRDQRFTELPIRLGFQGTFANVYSFLGRLEALARTKRIVELDLAADAGNPDVVRADMLLSIFCAKG
jgi:Tfp pilus assembly protein PilO